MAEHAGSAAPDDEAVYSGADEHGGVADALLNKRATLRSLAGGE